MTDIVIDIKVKANNLEGLTIEIISHYPIHEIRYIVNELLDVIEHEQSHTRTD